MGLLPVKDVAQIAVSMGGNVTGAESDPKAVNMSEPPPQYYPIHVQM